MPDSNLEILPILKPSVESYNYAVIAIKGWPKVKTDEKIKIVSEVKPIAKPFLLPYFANGRINTSNIISSLTQNLVGNCWEILVKNRYVTWDYNHPVIQFFRHIRNGCYHGNVFHFRGDEPIFPAFWRGKKIKRNLQGKRIFRENETDIDYLLDWEEAVLLISEASKILKK